MKKLTVLLVPIVVAACSINIGTLNANLNTNVSGNPAYFPPPTQSPQNAMPSYGPWGPPAYVPTPTPTPRPVISAAPSPTPTPSPLTCTNLVKDYVGYFSWRRVSVTFTINNSAAMACHGTVIVTYLFRGEVVGSQTLDITLQPGESRQFNFTHSSPTPAPTSDAVSPSPDGTPSPFPVATPSPTPLRSDDVTVEIVSTDP